MSEEAKNKSEYLVEVRDLKQYFPIIAAILLDEDFLTCSWVYSG